MSYQGRRLKTAYHRLKILEPKGCSNDDDFCLICNKEIRSINHFRLTHPEMYEEAKAMIGSGEFFRER